MGGIVGIINLDGAPVAREALVAMAQAAAHRGPDGIHYWQGEGAGLAHLALKVSPESIHERQPLVLQEADLVLVADARVDNRRELIHALASKGLLDKDVPTDADLILGAYRYWGTAAPAQIIGDFAFAVWDRRRRSLFAARDPMGMRSLYYRSEPNRLLFATEITQILEAPGVSPGLFEPAVGAHLVRYFDRLEWTLYEGILALQPGHALQVTREKTRDSRYWAIDPQYRIRYRDDQEYVEHFFELFQEAVRCRLRSTKPVGLMLSGGLDSGTIAATVGWMRQRGLLQCDPGFNTYSWTFERLTQCDERLVSDGIAHHYDLPTTHLLAEDAYPLKDYPARTPDRDEPTPAAYEGLWQRAMAQAQGQGVGTILTGGRGDLVMGMDIFDYLNFLVTGRWLRLHRELQAHSRWLNVSTQKLVRSHMVTPLKVALWPPQNAVWLRRPLQRLLRRPPSRQSLPKWIDSEFAERIELQKILTSPLRSEISAGFPRRQREQYLFLPSALKIDTTFERIAARFGLEAADPWSDRRITAFSAAVPQHILNRPRQRKRLARLTVQELLPPEVHNKMQKVSLSPLFETALKDWSRETVLQLIEHSKAASYGFLDEEKLRTYYENYCRGENEHPFFWYALTLEMWLRHYW